MSSNFIFNSRRELPTLNLTSDRAQGRDANLAKARQARQARELAARQTRSAIWIQKIWRGYSARCAFHQRLRNHLRNARRSYRHMAAKADQNDTNEACKDDSTAAGCTLDSNDQVPMYRLNLYQALVRALTFLPRPYDIGMLKRLLYLVWEDIMPSSTSTAASSSSISTSDQHLLTSSSSSPLPSQLPISIAEALLELLLQQKDQNPATDHSGQLFDFSDDEDGNKESEVAQHDKESTREAENEASKSTVNKSNAGTDTNGTHAKSRCRSASISLQTMLRSFIEAVQVKRVCASASMSKDVLQGLLMRPILRFAEAEPAWTAHQMLHLILDKSKQGNSGYCSEQSHASVSPSVVKSDSGNSGITIEPRILGEIMCLSAPLGILLREKEQQQHPTLQTSSSSSFSLPPINSLSELLFGVVEQLEDDNRSHVDADDSAAQPQTCSVATSSSGGSLSLPPDVFKEFELEIRRRAVAHFNVECDRMDSNAAVGSASPARGSGCLTDSSRAAASSGDRERQQAKDIRFNVLIHVISVWLCSSYGKGDCRGLHSDAGGAGERSDAAEPLVPAVLLNAAIHSLRRNQRSIPTWLTEASSPSTRSSSPLAPLIALSSSSQLMSHFATARADVGCGGGAATLNNRRHHDDPVAMSMSAEQKQQHMTFIDQLCHLLIFPWIAVSQLEGGGGNCSGSGRNTNKKFNLNAKAKLTAVPYLHQLRQSIRLEELWPLLESHSNAELLISSQTSYSRHGILYKRSREDSNSAAASAVVPSSSSAQPWLVHLPYVWVLFCQLFTVQIQTLDVKAAGLHLTTQQLRTAVHRLRDAVFTLYTAHDSASLNFLSPASADFLRSATQFLNAVHVLDDAEGILGSVDWLCPAFIAPATTMSNAAQWRSVFAALTGTRQNGEDDDDDDDSDEDDEDRFWSQRMRQTQLVKETPGTQLIRGTASVLLSVPYVVPFDFRVHLFGCMLKEERAAFRMPSEDIIVNRGSAWIDAYENYHTARAESLKHWSSARFVAADGHEEMGYGPGVFREFLMLAVKQAFDLSSGLFYSSDDGVYPRPHAEAYAGPDATHQYIFLGRLVGKALRDGIQIDIPLARFFRNAVLGRTNGVNDLASYDKELDSRLRGLRVMDNLQELGLTFTYSYDILGEPQEVELCSGGCQTPVTKANLSAYVHLLADFKLNREIRAQTLAFRKGVFDMVPESWLRFFDAGELQTLIQGQEEDIPLDVDDWATNTRYNGDFNEKHPTVRLFWKVVREMSAVEQRQLLQFSTGSSRAPLLGFSHLTPPFNLTSTSSDENHLPSAATCACLLKLPSYSDAKRMREKLLLAISECQTFEMS